jgi:hypothetical protein
MIMQTVIQVLCKGSKSLREAIVTDKKLEGYRLDLVQSKNPHRSPGWAKVRSLEGEPGAINFDWSASSRTLTCRVVTRHGNKPNNIVGDFIAYLLARHSTRIITVLLSQTK